MLIYLNVVALVAYVFWGNILNIFSSLLFCLHSYHRIQIISRWSIIFSNIFCISYFFDNSWNTFCFSLTPVQLHLHFPILLSHLSEFLFWGYTYLPYNIRRGFISQKRKKYIILCRHPLITRVKDNALFSQNSALWW